MTFAEIHLLSGDKLLLGVGTQIRRRLQFGMIKRLLFNGTRETIGCRFGGVLAPLIQRLARSNRDDFLRGSSVW